MLSITINNQPFTFDLSSESWITPSTTLNDLLRHHTPFHATKIACNEGGCGACTVALTFTDIVSGKTVTRGINSCLAPVMSLNGMSVTTNDGIGNLQAPHAIQKKLADLSGTQCGYCSSGMVMSMYSFLAENPTPTAAEVEAMLDGNLCRCTGYRPILEAFKTFSADEHSCNKEKCCKKLNGLPIEIEDAARTLAIPAKTAAPTLPAPQLTVLPRPQRKLGAQQVQWIEVDREDKLQYWLNHLSGLNVMLVVGATTQALDRVDYDAYLDVHRIPSFNVITQDATGITLGAAITFTDAIKYFDQALSPSGTSDVGVYQLKKHFLRVASTLIRNRGCVAGNLVYTHRHQSPSNAFPSDATIALMGMGAKVTLVLASTGAATTVGITEFLSTPLTGSYVKSIWIPWTGANETFRSYKIAIRQTLDHAIVNAGMKATVDPKTNFVTGSPIIAVGGIFSAPTRLTTVETAMVGLDVTKSSTLTSLCALFTTAIAAIDPTPGRVEYRKQVALNYFYKFMLSLQPSLPSDLANAADVWMTRPVTKSSQTFTTKEDEYPVSLPIPKIDGLAQTTGQAVYTADIPTPYGCVFGALVLTTAANAPITSVNAAAANNVPGFVTYLDASSVSTSANQWMMFGQNICPMFATTTSLFAGQVVGCVFATSEVVARDCAALIQGTITYGPSGPVIVDVVDALNPVYAQQPFPGGTTSVTSVDSSVGKADVTATGSIRIKPQYHFHLENHAVLVQPVEGQLVVDLATQAASNAQASICNATGLPSSDIVVRTRRCGGGYGGKIIYPSQIACIASVAALKLQRPARLDLTFKDAMRSFGCRPDFEMTYSMGLKKDGTIVSLTANVNGAAGTQGAEAGEIVTILANLDNCYNVHNANFTAATYPSTVPPAAPVRGPGWIQSIAFSEIMMNQVASQVNIAPDVLRHVNLYKNGDTTPNGTWIRGTPVSALWDKMYPHFQARQQDATTFNASSTFVKRGVSINPTRFNVAWGGPFNCLVTIFADGSITVVHGGTEIGQGINTKVAQGVAFKLGLDAEDVVKYIKIQPTTTTVCSSMGNVTGGSVTSEMCTMAVMRACDTLNDRLAPYRSSQQSWQSLIQAASQNNVDLVATGYGTVQRTTGGPARYNSWGCAVTEVELDTLTGQFEIKQTDLLFDCGVSMNPIIDIGQVEGGFMFGVGWFTSEIVQWDKTTGEAVMAGSWRYKPPGAHDLPEVFNVTLLENSNNTVGVLGSKAVGEPPLALGVSVLLALENAVNAVRSQNGQSPFTVSCVPMTVDDIAVACAVTSQNFVLPSQ